MITRAMGLGSGYVSIIIFLFLLPSLMALRLTGSKRTKSRGMTDGMEKRQLGQAGHGIGMGAKRSARLKHPRDEGLFTRGAEFDPLGVIRRNNHLPVKILLWPSLQ